MRASADHGDVERALGSDLAATEAVLLAAAAEGLDLEAITGELEREGVESLCDSYEQLPGCIESKVGTLVAMP